jgi:hypothetical protein
MNFIMPRQNKVLGAKMFFLWGGIMKLLKHILFFTAVFAIWCEVTEAKMMILPTYVSFGTVDVKGYYNPSQSVTIYNQSDEAISLSFSNGCSFSDFSFQAYTCSHVEKNGSCNVNISFTPSHNGYFSCNLSILDSTNDMQSVLISGYGTGGDF